MKTKQLLAVLAVALALTSCAIKWKGQHLLSVNPDGELYFHHPEDWALTNRVAVEH